MPYTADVASHFAERIIRARRAAKLTQEKLGEHVGVTSQSVSGWERGLALPEARNIPRIASALRIDPIELLKALDADHHGVGPVRASVDAEDDAPEGTVPIIGYIGAGARVHYYHDVSPGDLDEAPAPAGLTPKTVALEVRGEGLGRIFDRWLVYFDDVRSPPSPNLLGRLCVAELSDGRVLVKKLNRGKVSGAFDLVSEIAEPIRDVTLAWAVRVKNLAPRL
jgi:transcriptional regulator with XRE-family HTH domain